MPLATTSIQPINSVRRFARPFDASAAIERCDLCGSAIGPKHRHLFELAARRLICACNRCVQPVPEKGQTGYLLVPRKARRLQKFAMSDTQWNTLGIPLDLAFFSLDSRARKIRVVYPSPEGTTESELLRESWDELTQKNPPLASIQADVEALLVNRTRNRKQYFVAPIDCCYELAGRVRSQWRGHSGGAAVWEAIDRFFAELAADARA